MRRFAALALLMLFGCATPTVMLKNEQTGQIARCGGDTSGSMAGGLIGYNMQKSNDENCVHSYEALGFKRVP
jgi:hypothetical protein